MFKRFIVTSILAVLWSIVFIVPTRPAFAASYTAGTADELVAAINTANSTPEADTIVLTHDILLTTPPEIHPVEGNSGLPSITSDITIQGEGFLIARTDNAPEFRIMRVGQNGSLTIVNLTILDGLITQTYVVGAGILNSGILVVD